VRMRAGLIGIVLAGAAHAATLAPGDHRFVIQSGGLQRSYIVHVPPSGIADLPVILNFHGGGGNALSHQKYVHMDTVADREGILVVYPNGTGRLESKLLTWNAGACCGEAARGGVDDVGFATRLLDDLAARNPYDRSRVYATGFSNGAMMAYRLAAELSGKIAAIAPVSGTMLPDRIEAKRPVPIMHIHSVDDPRALYAGGLGPPFPFTTVRVMHLPVEATLSKWAEFDGCALAPVESARRDSHEGAAWHTATRLVYGGCRAGAEIVLWKLAGPGHVWPGGTRDYLTRWLGPSTRVIDANEEIVRFFLRFSISP
jgi:polyhydroxybutyrate depolymerase